MFQLMKKILRKRYIKNDVMNDKLPNNNIITLNTKRFGCPEQLFNRSTEQIPILGMIINFNAVILVTK